MLVVKNIFRSVTFGLHGPSFAISGFASSTGEGADVVTGIGNPLLNSLLFIDEVSAPSPVPVAEVLGGGTIGVAYSETILAQSGTSPYSFAITSGALPAGLALSAAGVISGTPTTAATSTFSVTVTDHAGQTGSQQFSITIAGGSASAAPANYCLVN